MRNSLCKIGVGCVLDKRKRRGDSEALPTAEPYRLWTRTQVLSVGISICFDSAVSFRVCVLEPPLRGFRAVSHINSKLERNHMRDPTDEITLGITNDRVALGSHLIHFWQNEEEFERGVRFLQLGIENETQYCVLFGHDEANQQVLEILRKKYPELDRVIREGRLVILRREDSASETLAKIEE